MCGSDMTNRKHITFPWENESPQAAGWNGQHRYAAMFYKILCSAPHVSCLLQTYCIAGRILYGKPSKVKRRSSAAAKCWPFLYRSVCSIVVSSKQCWKTINKISDSWDTWPWVDPQGKKILKVGFHSEGWRSAFVFSQWGLLGSLMLKLQFWFIACLTCCPEGWMLTQLMSLGVK